MTEAGLLEVEYRRLSGRVGPGAGRPAKAYSLSPRFFSVEIPQTRYVLAASMMATALSGGAGVDGAEYLQDVATAVGEGLGDEIRRQARTKPARLQAVKNKLKQLGYEPRVQESGEWTMRNCIFAELSKAHRDIVCPMNAAFMTGLVGGAHLPSLHVENRTAPPGCCVQLAPSGCRPVHEAMNGPQRGRRTSRRPAWANPEAGITPREPGVKPCKVMTQLFVNVASCSGNLRVAFSGDVLKL